MSEYISRDAIIDGIYRHFKGNLYKLLLVATDTETGKETAIYESLKDGKLWCRPLEMFLSPVDREKYPDVKQELRFELYKCCPNCGAEMHEIVHEGEK